MASHNDQSEGHNDRLAKAPSSEASYEKMPEGSAETQLEHELLVSGYIYPAVSSQDGIEIHRGMKILTNEGETAGVVAGVLHSRSPYQAEYILLSRPSQQLEYRLVPVELIQQVSKENVLLHIAAPIVNTLHPWHN